MKLLIELAINPYPWYPHFQSITSSSVSNSHTVSVCDPNCKFKCPMYFSHLFEENGKIISMFLAALIVAFTVRETQCIYTNNNHTGKSMLRRNICDFFCFIYHSHFFWQIKAQWSLCSLVVHPLSESTT